MSRLSFLKTSSLKILLGIFIFVIINLFFGFCGPYETQGGINPGWHVTCGDISWITYALIMGLNKISGHEWFIELFIILFFSYIISSLIVSIFRKSSKKS